MNILRQPNTANYAPLSDPERLKLYQADMAAWEAQRDNAAPFWNPYSGIAGAHETIWAEARTWEGKTVRVTLADGSTRQGRAKLTSANAPNGQAGIAITVFDGWADNWCGAGFLAIEDLTPPPAPEQVEEPQAIVGLPSLADEAFWGSRLTPAEAKASVRRLRDDLGSLTANLGHLDHDASRAIERARSALFEAWSVIRATEKALLAREAR